MITNEEYYAYLAAAQQQANYGDPADLLRQQAEINARHKYGDFINLVEVDGVWQVGK